jgi:nucleoside-diphosphate-sugar epimerase
VKRVIHTSTSEVYSTAQYVPIDEKHPLQPQSPYSASKIGADAMAMASSTPSTCRSPSPGRFNTTGRASPPARVIPTIISQIANGKKQIQLGDVTPTRDFNYVTDTCRGFLELARCDKAIGETVDIGSNFEISVGDTLNLIRELMNSDVEIPHRRAAHPSGQVQRCSACGATTPRSAN